MRLTSAMWFAVFMRQETARGAYVSVIRSGSQQAGAIFIQHNHLDETLSLYGPAPQSMVDMTHIGDDRMFERILQRVSQSEVNEYLDRQIKFDPDIWIIETESGSGDPSLELIREI